MVVLSASHYASRRVWTAITASVFLLLTVCSYGPIPFRSWRVSTESAHGEHLLPWTHISIGHKQPACRTLPGADDVAVILKTGSTEFQDKFPIHIDTTLKCYPHSLVFSDYEETYQNVHIIDALEFIDSKTKSEHPDFELWRRLQEGGRAALAADELSGPLGEKEKGASGKPDNPGWRLDKWKFLPMVNRTLHEYPNKSWYIFVENDTYIFWQTLLAYLRQLDPSEPTYIGTMLYVGDIKFAHGGTGFVLSRPALDRVASIYQAKQAEWDHFVDEQWAGDAVLGAALKEAGARFIPADPILQGQDIGSVPYEDNDWWCRPSVSYHHLSPPKVEHMWDFEQEWIAENSAERNSLDFLRHCDVFDGYIVPRIANQTATARSDWTNHADVDEGTVAAFDECRDICLSHVTCLQFLVDGEMRCKTSEVPRLGETAQGAESGWLGDRIKSWREGRPPCPDHVDWAT